MLKPWQRLFFIVAFCLSLVSCTQPPENEVQSFFGYAMGTSYSIKVVTSLSKSRSLQVRTESALADINQRMSTYLSRSDLSKFSELGVEEFLKVDPKTTEVVEKALSIAKITDGFFDPTVAPLVDLWGFGPSPRLTEPPSEDLIRSVLSQVGYNAIAVDLIDSRLSKKAPRSLDLSAIAKGYAVDQIADMLDAENVSSYLIEVGGEMRFKGVKPSGQKWQIAIEKPDPLTREAFEILAFDSLAVATSGDYRNFYELDGQRYSHTINPKTGYPVQHNLASVTVVMSTAMEADAYATAFMVMGADRAFELAERESIAAYFILHSDDEFIVKSTRRFDEVFQ